MSMSSSGRKNDSQSFNSGSNPVIDTKYGGVS